jgi:hypothetical protein
MTLVLLLMGYLLIGSVLASRVLVFFGPLRGALGEVLLWVLLWPLLGFLHLRWRHRMGALMLTTWCGSQVPFAGSQLWPWARGHLLSLLTAEGRAARAHARRARAETVPTAAACAARARAPRSAEHEAE